VAFVEKHWFLTCARELTESRIKTWCPALHLHLSPLLWVFLSYNHLKFQKGQDWSDNTFTQKTTPKERNSRASVGETACQAAMTLTATRPCLTTSETMRTWTTCDSHLWPWEHTYEWDYLVIFHICLSLPPIFLLFKPKLNICTGWNTYLSSSCDVPMLH
jgi:hypothetical protein